nr:MAG TPA: prohead serine protease [Caudoviricetes sp.]
MPSDVETVTGDAAPATVVCNEADRIIEGMALPWGENGQTATGTFTFPRGSLRLPSELSSVKLLAEHSRPDQQPKAIGYAIAAEDTPAGLVMRFQLGTSAAATEALAAAADHTIDALSVEVVGVERTGGTIKNSLLKAVAMVPFPAFPGARIYAEDGTPIEAVETPAAPEPPQQETPMTKTTYPATSPIPVDDPKTLTADGAFPKISAAQAVEIICGVHTGKITGDEIHAALQNITGSGTLVTEPAVWLGEIWSSVEYERRLINLIDTQPLTGRRAKGFRWATDADTGKQLKPGVGKWSGDKTEITSKPVKFEEVDERAQPWAGGNDLDRQIIDFNESHTLLAYWRAMTESYKRETDMDVAAQLTTWATDVPEEQEDIIQAILFGGIYVEEEVLTPASYAIINPKDKRKIAKYTELNTPKFMDVTPVGSPDRWVTSPFVPEKTAIIGVRSATTFYELPGSPIRAHAEHIALGGQDVALFGYTAHIKNQIAGLVKVHFK